VCVCVCVCVVSLFFYNLPSVTLHCELQEKMNKFDSVSFLFFNVSPKFTETFISGQTV